jgi:transposase-like protein
MIMFNYKEKLNNNIRIIKKHHQFHINNSNIYINIVTYGKLHAHLAQKYKYHVSRYRRQSYWCHTCRISRLSENKERFTKK